MEAYYFGASETGDFAEIDGRRLATNNLHIDEDLNLI